MTIESAWQAANADKLAFARKCIEIALVDHDPVTNEDVILEAQIDTIIAQAQEG